MEKTADCRLHDSGAFFKYLKIPNLRYLEAI